MAGRSTCLSLGCLRNDLDKVAYRWYELGIQLEVDDKDLNAIEADTGRATACLRRVIRYFLHNPEDVSDEDRKKKLVKAMKSQSVGEIRRGGILERELHPPLRMKKLTTALSDVAAKWHSLGLQLDIPIGTLKEFEAYSRNVKRSFTEMLALWWEQSPTIEGLIDALRSVNERRLAGELEKKYAGYVIQRDGEEASDADSGYD